jgi:hypothetical protein
MCVYYVILTNKNVLNYSIYGELLKRDAMYRSCLYIKRKGKGFVIGFILLCTLAVLSSFSIPENNFSKKTGITGYVQIVSGNQMPSVDQPLASPRGIQTTLYVYELTNLKQVQQIDNSAFYKTITTRLVKKIQTKPDGSFHVQLKPGMYSLFIKKDELFYANIFDGANNIYPVKVEKGKMTTVHFRADYDAAY